MKPDIITIKMLKVDDDLVIRVFKDNHKTFLSSGLFLSSRFTKTQIAIIKCMLEFNKKDQKDFLKYFNSYLDIEKEKTRGDEQ